MAKPLPMNNAYFNIYKNDNSGEYNQYTLFNTGINFPYQYTYHNMYGNPDSSKIAWYTFSDITTKSKYIDAYQNAIVTKYGYGDSYEYAYFPMYAYYSIVPDLSTKINTSHKQSGINTGLDLDYCVINWCHNGNENGTTSIDRAKLICKDGAGNIIDPIKIHIKPISYIWYQESAKSWKKNITIIINNLFGSKTSYIEYSHDNDSVVPWGGYWNTRAMSYLYSYMNINIYGNISYLHPLVVMDYTHNDDENGWSRIHVGYVTATIDSAYSYYTNGTVFIKSDSSIWEYTNRYKSFDSNTANKKYLSCIKDYRHSGDENKDSGVQYTYLNCVF